MIFFFKLLASALKLFAKRPPEMQPILGNLFFMILNNEKEDVDLKDRAAFYYRLLQTNIDELSKILKDNKTEILSFIEDELNSKVENNKILIF
jgi:AP-4 complex subunit beta-1